MSSESKPAADPFRLTFVCTGNRARSPLAAALLRHKIGPAGVVVRSVGTLDVGPLPPLPEATSAGAALGVTIGGHRASALRHGGLVDSNLVVGFEPHHISAAVVEGGAAPEHVFSIIELAQLLAALDVRRRPRIATPQELIAIANASRAESFLSSARVPDPLGQPQHEFDRVARQIDELVGTLARALFPALIHSSFAERQGS